MINTCVSASPPDPPFTAKDFLEFQRQVTEAELRLWRKKACDKDSGGLWMFVDGRIALPKLAYESLIAFVHGVTHVNYKGILVYISKLFFMIGLEHQIKNFVRRCLICVRCNPDVSAPKHEHLGVFISFGNC